MKLFDWLTWDQKEKIKIWCITHQNYIGIGKGFFGWITEPLKLVFIGGAFVYPDVVRENALLSGLLVLFVYVIFPDRLGWWLDKKMYLHSQADWNNKRNGKMDQLDRIENLLLERKA